MVDTQNYSSVLKVIIYCNKIVKTSTTFFQKKIKNLLRILDLRHSLLTENELNSFSRTYLY